MHFYFENQDMTHSPNASTAYLNKLRHKMSQATAGNITKTVLCQKCQGTAKPKGEYDSHAA